MRYHQYICDLLSRLMTAHHREMPTTITEWNRLTVLPEKREAFSRDIYFRECWADLVGIYGNSVRDKLGRWAILIFKPDSVVGRRMLPTVDFVRRHGFVPIAAKEIEFTRHSMREVWRYNWHFATIDRIALSTLIYCATRTLMLVSKI